MSAKKTILRKSPSKKAQDSVAADKSALQTNTDELEVLRAENSRLRESAKRSERVAFEPYVEIGEFTDKQGKIHPTLELNWGSGYMQSFRKGRRFWQNVLANVELIQQGLDSIEEAA